MCIVISMILHRLWKIAQSGCLSPKPLIDLKFSSLRFWPQIPRCAKTYKFDWIQLLCAKLMCLLFLTYHITSTKSRKYSLTFICVLSSPFPPLPSELPLSWGVPTYLRSSHLFEELPLTWGVPTCRSVFSRPELDWLWRPTSWWTCYPCCLHRDAG